MKRLDLIRHLERHGAQLLREGGAQSVFVNRAAGKVSTVPRLREITTFSPARSARTSISRREFWGRYAEFCVAALRIAQPPGM